MINIERQGKGKDTQRGIQAQQKVEKEGKGKKRERERKGKGKGTWKEKGKGKQEKGILEEREHEVSKPIYIHIFVLECCAELPTFLSACL